jgi:salicylate hydroxylase
MGGLGAALALAKKGFKDIQVFESASNLGFVGAGIQMAPNLVRILTRFECWDEIEARSIDVLEASIRGTFKRPAVGNIVPLTQRSKMAHPIEN